MSAHSSAPWHVLDTGAGLTITSRDGTIAHLVRMHVGDDVTAANARLMAAAPELLAALEDVWGLCSRGQDVNDADWGAVKAAIAKAVRK